MIEEVFTVWHYLKADDYEKKLICITTNPHIAIDTMNENEDEQYARSIVRWKVLN